MTWHIIEAIIPLTILFVMCVAAGLILSTVCVFFRDLEYLWDVLLMLIMYCSAIFYDVNRIGDAAQVLKYNPLYCIITNFRCVVLYHGSIFTSYTSGFSDLKMMLYSGGFSLIALVVGVVMFKKYQDDFILHI